MPAFAITVPQPDKSNSVSTLSSATQADLLPSTSSIAATISESPHLIPVSDTLLSTTSNMFTPIEPSSSIISASTSNSSIQPPAASSTQNLKKKSKFRDRKRKKEVLKSIIDIKMAQHRPRKPAPVEYSTDEEDMIVYDVEEMKSNRILIILIVPQFTQTYAQAARPSTISTATQTDPTLSNIICPPLQCLTPISSKNPLPGTSCSVSTFSTSSLSTQDNLLPSPSGILPTIQGTESHSHTTPATLNSVSTENFPESVPNESNSEHSTAAEAQQIVKRKSRNRRKRSKIPKPNIEIKRVPHRSRNATPTEITTDDEDMITYDVEEEELQQDPFILPEGYLRALTPSRYRNYRE
ncbi:hypothetical protein TNCV_2796841 [Trichonephila clavipes]|nr:hypothetical protein TNCV_2796841 [Trichonephila clavipes]